MTNYEYYKEQIRRIVDVGLPFAVNKDSQKIELCDGSLCEDCLFGVDCDKAKFRWAYEEYIEPESVVDWSTIPVDTEVLVSTNKKYWISRYFAGIINGKTYAFSNSGTSKMTNKVAYWEYMKLAEVE